MNVLSIQSEVIYGHVGNAAARFALQRLGHEAWCVPTVLLTSHAAHPGFTGEATSPALLEKLVAGLEAQGRFAQSNAVISGYLGSPEQAAIVAGAVQRVKVANAKVLYCLDTVFGDDGKVYARPGVVEAMAETLLPLADVVTPNAFELATLTGLPVGNPDDALLAAERLNRPMVIAKSVPMGTSLGTLLVTPDEVWLASTPRVKNPPRGAGDLFAALLIGQLLAGHTASEALQLAVRSTYHVLERSAGEPEMHLITEQQALAAPPLPPAFKLERIEKRRRVVG